MATRMQQRRGTAEQWTTVNPTLAEGEIGVETDTNKFKIGNGTSDWSTLAYATSTVDLTGYATTSYVDNAIDTVVGLAPATLDTLAELATALGDDPNAITTIQSDITTLQSDVATKASIVNTELTGSATAENLDISGTLNVGATNIVTSLNSKLEASDLTGYATETYVNNSIAAIPAPDFTGYATETYVDTSIANLVDTAPATLDTLNELAAALGDDPNFATTVTNSIAGKADASHTHILADVTDVTATASELNVLDGITATTTELNYTDGVTSNIQTQLDQKAANSHTHTSSQITDLTTNVVSRTNGTVSTASTSSTVVRNITLSTANPSGGTDGDVWLKYTA